MPRSLQGVLLFMGSIIGVGVFALPYAISRAGFFLGLSELILLAVAVLCIHLMYGDVVANTEGHHQMPGYVRRILGRKAAWVSSATSLMGFFVLTAYVLVGSKFLSYLLAPVIHEYALPAALAFYFIVGVVAIWKNNSVSTEIDGFFVALLVILLLLLSLFGLSSGSLDRLGGVHFSEMALPYGVILFALMGASIIPRVHETLGRASVRTFRSVVIIGSSIPAILYVCFSLAVISAGPVSMDSIGGMALAYGPTILFLGSAVGFLSSTTAFIGLGLTLRETLNYDFGISKQLSWITTLAVPFLLVFAGVSDFVKLIALVGAFTIGIDSIMIVTMWHRLRSHRLLSFVPREFAYPVALFFICGVLFEAIHFLGGL